MSRHPDTPIRCISLSDEQIACIDMSRVLGTVGRGVGGIETMAAALGSPSRLAIPEVVECRLEGVVPAGVPASDLVLTITRALRRFGIVKKIVELPGPGAAALALPHRATIANMAPECGATIGFFAPDLRTVNYFRQTERAGHRDRSCGGRGARVAGRGWPAIICGPPDHRPWQDRADRGRAAQPDAPPAFFAGASQFPRGLSSPAGGRRSAGP